MIAKPPSILRLNPRRDPLKPCVYVGMTELPIDHRLENHKKGYKSAWVVKKYGVPAVFVQPRVDARRQSAKHDHRELFSHWVFAIFVGACAGGGDRTCHQLRNLASGFSKDSARSSDRKGTARYPKTRPQFFVTVCVVFALTPGNSSKNAILPLGNPRSLR
jgi:hypothetical protein